MARGSEQFAFKQNPDTERVCAVCRRELRRDDVATVNTSVEYRNGVGYATTVYWCKEHRLGRAA